MPNSKNPSLGMSRDSGDFCGLSPVETPKGPRKPSGCKRARSLDRQVPKNNPESSSSRCPSSATCRRTASDGARSSESRSRFAEARGAAPAALPLEERNKFLPSEQGPPEDTKKERPPREAQQNWFRIVLNLLLMRIEEPREKGNRTSKGKGDLPEAAEEPAFRKKSQDKKTSRKKHSHRKPIAEEPSGPRTAEAQGQEDTAPRVAASHATEESDLRLICRGGPDSDLPQALPSEGDHAETPDGSSQATGPPSEEDPRKPDQDDVIRQIVELIKKAGDRLEEEQAQVPQPEAVPPQKPTPPPRKKSQERKSNLKRALSLKKLSSEEPKRVGIATILAPETRPKRPSFLPLCVSGPRTSTSSSRDSEAPTVSEVRSGDGGGSRPSELHPPAAVFQGPEEKPLLDRASESREFRQKILALLQSAEEEKGEEAEEAGENPTPARKAKSQVKKSNLRRVFSLGKHSSKESKKTEASGPPVSGSLEARPPKRHGFLPMCVSGHRASICSSTESPEFQKMEAAGEAPAGSPEVPFQPRSHAPDVGSPPEGAESKELVIQKLVTSLQEVDSELGRQIRKYPSFKRFFNEFSDASLRQLLATLDRQKARQAEEDRNLTNRPPPCAFGTLNKFAANHSCAICTLMQSRGHYKGHSYAHFLSRKAQQDIMSLDCQSPD